VFQFGGGRGYRTGPWIDEKREAVDRGIPVTVCHPAAEDRAVAVVDAFQIVEEFRRSYVAGDGGSRRRWGSEPSVSKRRPPSYLQTELVAF